MRGPRSSVQQADLHGRGAFTEKVFTRWLPVLSDMPLIGTPASTLKPGAQTG
jgi:hypothetical protein